MAPHALWWGPLFVVGAGAFRVGAPARRRVAAVIFSEPMTRAEYERDQKLKWLREALPDVTLSKDNLPARPPPELPKITTLTGAKLTVENATDRLAGERLVVQFECFGAHDSYEKMMRRVVSCRGERYMSSSSSESSPRVETFERCLVDLAEDGSVEFSAGLVGSGDWRCVPGDPSDGEDPSDVFLEFSQDLDETRAIILGVPGGAVFWRGRVADDSACSLRLVDGVAISEAQNPLTKQPWTLDQERLENIVAWASGTRFQREGNFTAALVTSADDGDLPESVVLEFKSAESSKAFDKSARRGSLDTQPQLSKKKKGFSSTSV